MNALLVANKINTKLRTCLKHSLDSLHAVSTVNLVLKMLHSLAPYPLRPPSETHGIHKAQAHLSAPWCDCVIRYYWCRTCDLLLVVVVVAGSEQLAEDERWHVHLLHFVLHHRNALPVVPDADGGVLSGVGQKQIKRILVHKPLIFKAVLFYLFINLHKCKDVD